MKLTILGSCRQHSLNTFTSSIQEGVSYPHYTKEIIEVIKFCKFGHLTPEETTYSFRTPILTKTPLVHTQELKRDFESSDLFVIEIASKIFYKYKNIYVHHIASESEYNLPIKNEIEIGSQTKDEIEKDIITILEMLDNKPVIIVSHLVTYQKGERYILSEWLEEICNKYNIPFINPVKEFVKRNISIDNLFESEKNLAHYNHHGHNTIKEIYLEYINNLLGKSIPG